MVFKYESVPTSILLSGFGKSDRIFHSFHHRWSSPKHRGLKRRWCIVYKKVEMRASLGLIGASYRWVVSGNGGLESWLLSQGGLDGRLKERGWTVGFLCVFVCREMCPVFVSEASRVSQRDGIMVIDSKKQHSRHVSHVVWANMLLQLYKSNMLGAKKQILRWESLPAQKILCTCFFWVHQLIDVKPSQSGFWRLTMVAQQILLVELVVVGVGTRWACTTS